MHLEACIENATDLLGLATELLCLGRRQRAAYDRARNSPANVYVFNALVLRAERLFRRVRGEGLAPEIRQALIQLVQELPAAPEVIRAYALAVGLDLAVGKRLALGFRNRETVLSPNDAIPICRPPLKEIFGSGLSPHPHHSSDAPDRIRHLALVPQDLGATRLTLDARDADQSCPLIDLQHQVLATGVPNRSEDEFRMEVHEENGASFLFLYAPRDAERQRDRLLRILRRAVAEGATVLVLPELCADAESLAAMVEELRGSPGALRLLVAGSHHVRDPGGVLRNECVAVLRGSRRLLRHRKFSPYVLRDRKKGEIREGIASGPRSLTVFLSDHWSFTLLVCKDLLDPSVRHLLEDLGVSLVLVPALTPKTGQFQTYTAALAHTNQAVVVVANNPIFQQGEPVHSIFSVPRQKDYQKVVDTSSGSPPGLCCYRLSDGTTTWIDCPSKVD
jgi:predicted amidohydrolase